MLRSFLIYLEDSALFRLLKLAGMLSIAVAVLFWFLERDARQQARHTEAWRLIYAAAGFSGDGGRRRALETLNNGRIRLDGAPLSGASLRNIVLLKSKLNKANFQGADLSYGTLDGSVANDANFQKAKLFTTNLRCTSLQRADFTGADLVCADFSGSITKGASFEGAEFCKTIMPDGSINDQDCENTDLGSSGICNPPENTITEFDHIREGGLAECLRKAAAAVEKQERKQ